MEIRAEVFLEQGGLRIRIDIDGIFCAEHKIDNPASILNFIRGLSSYSCLAWYDPQVEKEVISNG